MKKPEPLKGKPCGYGVYGYQKEDVASAVDEVFEWGEKELDKLNGDNIGLEEYDKIYKILESMKELLDVKK